MDIDINDLRSIITAVSFVTFVGIVLWAWSSRRKAAFEEAAHLVFDDEDDMITRNAHAAERR
jgi:cytochrome c oxidase cbb3-type subunit 4